MRTVVLFIGCMSVELVSKRWGIDFVSGQDFAQALSVIFIFTVVLDIIKK